MAMKFKKKSVLFYSFFIPPCAILLFLVMETTCRVYDFGENICAQLQMPSRIDPLMQEDDRKYQEAKRLTPPPDFLPWRAPPQSILSQLDAQGRQDLAQQRGELILLCDEEGTAYEVYPYTANEKLAYLSHKVCIGHNIKEMLPGTIASDILDAIQRTKNKAMEWIHHYPLPVTDTQVYIYDFRCICLSDTPLRFALFFSDSVYEDIYKRYRPNAYCDNYKQDYLDSMFWTNSLGYRDREITLPKPACVFRIICTGGSTTVEGPYNELTYPKYLERMLRERFNTDNIEVVNCGMDAATLITEYDRFEEFLALEPDLILHYNIINDLPAILQAAGNESGMKNGRLGRLRYYGSYSMLLRKLFNDWFELPICEVEEQITKQAISVISQMNDTARKQGVTFVACSFALPDIQKVSKGELILFDNSFWDSYLVRFTSRYYKKVVKCYNTLLLRFCSENHVPYMPVAEHLTGGLELFSDICHLRVPGIEKKAAIICEYLAPYLPSKLMPPKERTAALKLNSQSIDIK